MMLALPAWSRASWKKSSRLRSLQLVPPLPLWMHPVWMPVTAAAGVNDGVAVLAAVTWVKSTSHDAELGTVLGSPVAEVPYQATSMTPGDTTSRVGKVAVPLVVESVTGAVHVAPLSLLDAYLITTPPLARPPLIALPSAHATYTVPAESTFTGAKLYSVSKALPVLPVLGIDMCVQVSPPLSERDTPTPPPLAPPFCRL